MKSRKVSAEKNIQRYILKTYLVMACISVFIELILCIFLVVKTNRTMSEGNAAELDKVVLQLDNMFGEIENQAKQLSGETLVHKVLSYSGRKNFYGAQVLDVKSLMEDFADRCAGYKYITDIFLLNTNQKYMIGSNEIFHENEYAAQMRAMEFSEDAAKQMIGDKKSSLYVTHSGDADCRMFFIQGIYKKSYCRADAYLIVEMDTKLIEEFIDTICIDEAKNCYLADDTLGYIGTSESIGPLVEQIQKENKVFASVSFDRNRYIYSARTSEHMGLSYYYVSEWSSYYADVFAVVCFVIISMFVLSGVSVWLARWFTKKNTEPLKKISQVLDCENVSDEKFTYEEIYRNASVLSDQIIKYRDFQDQNRLTQIVLGQEKSEKVIAAYEKEHEQDISDEFYVMEVKLLDLTELSDYEILVFCVKNIFSEILAQDLILHPVEDWDKVYMLIRSRTPAVEEKIREAMKFMENRVTISSACGISEKLTSFSKIHRGKAQADYMVEYVELIHGENIPAWYEDAASGIRKDKGIFSDNLKRLMNTIMISDYADGKKALRQIWDENIAIPNIEPDCARTRMITVISVISVPYKERYKTYVLGKPQKNVRKMYEFADQMLEKLSQKDENDTDGKDVYEKMRMYIMEHATHPAITAGSISEHFNRTASYASSMFKKYTGEGILDVIHKERIRQAKLLLKGDMSVQDVAAKCGYLDARGFIRTFKKYEGVTPGQFKSMQKAGGENI